MVSVILGIFPTFRKKKIKKTLIIGKKVEKIADSKAKFELKFAPFYVLQGKKYKITLIIVPKNRKNTR